METRLGYRTPNEDAELLHIMSRPQLTRYQTAVLAKELIEDNVATPIFTIETTNEDGSNDGGVYACWVRGVVGHAAMSNSGSPAVRAFGAHFTRALRGAGDIGANSAVVEDHDDCHVATVAGVREIAGITLTVAETSEYLQTVSLTVDLTGSAVHYAYVTFLVELFWHGFLTPPTITPA